MPGLQCASAWSNIKAGDKYLSTELLIAIIYVGLYANIGAG
jgi:hypothetical protein